MFVILIAAFRIFWVFAIMSAATVVLYLMGYQLKYLLSHPVVVNIEVIYNESLKFPSVTVCNQNTFRYIFSCDYFIYTITGCSRIWIFEFKGKYTSMGMVYDGVCSFTGLHDSCALCV
jgi:hypothetical protein